MQNIKKMVPALEIVQHKKQKLVCGSFKLSDYFNMMEMVSPNLHGVCL